MASHRYIAEAVILPRFIKERGVHAVLDAVERKDTDFFIPVWFEAGFQFTPHLVYSVSGPLRVGVIAFPMPRESTEAYLGIVVGSTKDPAVSRYLTWELSAKLGFEGETGTIIGEWSDRGHGNFGRGPAFTGNLPNDLKAVVDRVLDIVAGAN